MTRSLVLALAGFSAVALATPAVAQSQPAPRQADPRYGTSAQSPAARQALAGSDQPDVLLDVPNLSVEQITLEVDNLNANIALDARLANILKLTAGADVGIDKVKLEIKGVKAQATLIVRLDNVRAIIERTLQTLDNNPAIIQTLGSTVNNTVGTVGGVANNAVGTVGNVANQALGTVGNLTSGLLRSGQILDLGRAGLNTVSQSVNSAGQTVRRLRAGDGSLYEVVTDSANRILRSRQLGR